MPASIPPAATHDAQVAEAMRVLQTRAPDVLNAIDEAASKGARFMVFPETFVPYYPYFSFVLPPALQGAEHLKLYERAVVVPGPVTQAVSAAARATGSRADRYFSVRCAPTCLP